MLWLKGWRRLKRDSNDVRFAAFGCSLANHFAISIDMLVERESLPVR